MVRIVEVGPRDGLQNETATVPTELKVAFVDALSRSGVDEIEVSAFVSSRWVPQLSDAEEVFGRIRRREGVVYSALVPNEQGFERALSANADKVSVFTAASETFTRKNINTSIQGSLERFAPVVRRAGESGLPVRGYVSTAFWCPYEGYVGPDDVLRVIDRLLDLGVDEISLSDTIGKASREEVERLLERVLSVLDAGRIAVHFHDTYGRGVDNTVIAYEHGIRTFDASAGGLGGCPYAPGASGNAATEKVVQAFQDAGVPLEIDLEALAEARRIIEACLDGSKRPIPEHGSAACLSCEFAAEETCCGRA